MSRAYKYSVHSMVQQDYWTFISVILNLHISPNLAVHSIFGKTYFLTPVKIVCFLLFPYSVQFGHFPLYFPLIFVKKSLILWIWVNIKNMSISNLN